MIELKRDVVKYIRDRAKARYVKDKECNICGATEDLDLHHYYSLSPLLHRWMRLNRLPPESVLEFRDEFIAKHEDELFKYVVTLCRTDHQRLHKTYGKHPTLGTAKKQMKWVEIQRNKHE